MLNCTYYLRQRDKGEEGNIATPDVLDTCVLALLSKSNAYKTIVVPNFLGDKSWTSDSWSNKQHKVTACNRAKIIWNCCHRTTLDAFVQRSKENIKVILDELSVVSQISSPKASALVIVYGMTEFSEQSFDPSLLLLKALGHHADSLGNLAPHVIVRKAAKLNQGNVVQQEAVEEKAVPVEVHPDEELGNTARLEALENRVAEIQDNMNALKTSMDAVLALLQRRDRDQ